MLWTIRVHNRLQGYILRRLAAKWVRIWDFFVRGRVFIFPSDGSGGKGVMDITGPQSPARVYLEAAYGKMGSNLNFFHFLPPFPQKTLNVIIGLIIKEDGQN
jgi:hypothetical protein